jgi:tetratricopeptide (TPR) repeat protein
MLRPFARFLLSAAIVILPGAASAQTPAPDALLAKAEELSSQGKYDLAIDAAKKALAAAEQTYGANDLRTVKPLKTLGLLYQLKGQKSEAEAQYRRALAVLQGSGGGANEIAEVKAKLALLASETAKAAALGEEKSATPPAAAPPRTRALTRGIEAHAAPRKETETVPFFPWPPPQPSARYVFPDAAFSRYATVGDVTSAILNALEKSGYVERSFFQTQPGGVALVTRLERIGGDGSPAPEDERWPSGFENSPAGFIDFVRGLFYAKPGYYRVIVFILQETAFAPSGQDATGKDAETWLQTGAIKLPAWLANRPFGKDSTCTAMIYEFQSDGNSVKGVVSNLTGKQHLQKAGLLAALEAPN